MLSKLNQRISHLEGVYSKYRKDESRMKTEIDQLEHKVKILEKVSEALKMILQALVHEDIEGIRSIITDGLQTIFNDQNLSLGVESSIKRGKVNIDFSVFDHNKDVGGDVLDSFGGGVANIVSLLFRFITILKLKLYPFLALDESLGAVSEEYLDNTGQFLKALCAKSGFDILLVTHQPRFLDFADTAYEGSLKDSQLILKEK